MPRQHPNYDRYVRDIRANCPYPYWKRLRDEARVRQAAKGHEARKSLVHLQEQCFFNGRGGIIFPGSRSHRTNLTRLRFRERYNLWASYVWWGQGPPKRGSVHGGRGPCGL